MAKLRIYSDLTGAPYINVPGPSHESLHGEQGELVGLNAAGEVVHATAAADGAGSEESGPVAARGVLFPNRVTDMDQVPDNDYTHQVRMQMAANDTIAGEHRITMLSHGFVLQNEDQDWGFDCSQPVYLGTDGGLTQTKPSTVGEIVQAIGFPIALDRYPAGEAVWVDVDLDFEVVA